MWAMQERGDGMDRGYGLSGSPLSRRSFVTMTAASALLATAPSLWGCGVQEGESGSAAEDAAVPIILEPVADPIASLIANLPLEHKVAQLFVVRPEDMLGAYRPETQAEDVDEAAETLSAGSGPLTVMDERVWAAIQGMPVGGFAFFGDNLLEPGQTQALLSAMGQAVLDACGVAPLLCVDEEGGTVARIGRNEAFGVDNVGDMAAVGASGDPQNAQAVTETIGSYLRPLGFNVDFAPVCDVANNPESQVMAQRSFGADANAVAAMVAACVTGFVESGVACCLKHFPGLGAAVGDSHTARISIDASLDQLETLELKPFEAGIAAGAPLVMMGHLSVPAIVGDETPASLSPRVVTDLLRTQLGFDGVVITDAMEMGAVTNYYTAGESAVLAIQAGCDIVLMPKSLDEAYGAVLDAVYSGAITEQRVDESLRRILKLKQRYPLPLTA